MLHRFRVNKNTSSNAHNLSAAIFRAHQSETGNDYRNVIRQKGLALKQKHNEEIIGRLLNGSMSPDDFANTDLEVRLMLGPGQI